MVSTIPGLPGRVELLGFARALGLRPEWLQKLGSEFEHFDVLGKKIDDALAAGARKVDRRALMEVVWAKREARTGSKKKRAYAIAGARARRAAAAQREMGHGSETAGAAAASR